MAIDMIPATLHHLADALTALYAAYEACDGRDAQGIVDAERCVYRAIRNLIDGQYPDEPPLAKDGVKAPPDGLVETDTARMAQCSRLLSLAGKAAPLSCAICSLGPCIYTNKITNPFYACPRA
jgi:hypothetical protein